MSIRGFYFILLFLVFGHLLWAQGHEELLGILENDMPYAIKKQQITSFILENKDSLSPKELAECFHDIGNKWHSTNYRKTRDHSELLMAIAITEKSLKLKRQLKDSEQCTINKTLYNLGLFNSWNSNIYVAREYYQEVVRSENDLCLDKIDDDSLELSYHGMGEFYLQIGDFYKALKVYDKLITNYDSAIDRNYNYQIWTYIRIAEIYSDMDLEKNSALVKFNLDKALNYLNQSGIPCCYYENRINQLEGNRLSEIGQYKDAISNYKEVILNLDRTDSVNLASATNSLGLAYLEFGEKVPAEDILLKAISWDSNYDAPYNNMGDLYLSNNDYQKALGSYQTAIDLSINTNLDLDFDQLPNIEQMGFAANKIELLNHIVTKANAWISYYEYNKNIGNLQAALNTFTLADQLVDLIRFVSNEQASKLYWREKSSALYMKAVKACYLLNKPAEAFHFMERNKALLLLEDLTHEEAKDIALLPQNLAQHEFKLKSNIFLAENELFESDNTNSKHIDSLKAQVSDSKYVYEEYIDSLNTAYPDYAKYRQNATILSFDELQTKYLTNDKAVVHYILNEEDGYGLLTTKEKSILFRLEHADQLNTSIEQFNALLVDGQSDLNTLSEQSHSLFTNIIPVAIYNQIKGKQLIIVPDYTLQRLPFETLIVDAEQQKYLLEAAEISYVYSMSLLAHHHGLGKNTSEQFLGVAPVRFKPLGLAALNSSQGELTGIAGFFNSEVLLSNNATKANFLNRAVNPRVIHLATHADVGMGENPWIAFSDEKMYLKEIYATKTMSDMVVLSACNTSDGNLKRGEGVMSLARGFFYSGAKSVVSSLWPVTDESGKNLMISFYKNLDKGYSKSKALKEAKLNYLKTTKAAELKHPFYWAGYVVLGDNTPLLTSGNSPWMYAGIVLLLVLIYFFRRKLFKRIQ